MKHNKTIEELLETQRVKNINIIHNEQLTVGQQISDKIATGAGSWTFIISFMVLLILWIILNTWVLLNKPFDAYPFILLNLVLSSIAALQAPIIMMSQNRQEAKDRLRAENDFLMDEKSEIIIEELYKKILNMEEKLNKIEKKLVK